MICAYGPESGRPMEEKQRFYDELACEQDLHSNTEVVLGMVDFKAHVGNRLMDSRVYLEVMDLVTEIGNAECCWSSAIRRIYVLLIPGSKKKTKKKIAFRSGENRTEIDFVLVGKGQRKYLKDVIVIPGELQHRLMGRRVWKLKKN